jgi:hypothetical protein
MSGTEAITAECDATSRKKSRDSIVSEFDNCFCVRADPIVDLVDRKRRQRSLPTLDRTIESAIVLRVLSKEPGSESHSLLQNSMTFKKLRLKNFLMIL